MVTLYRSLSREAASNSSLTYETSFHAAKLTCALLLFASSWMLSLPPLAAWTLSIVGYGILTVSVAALVAEADWEPRVNFALGIVLLAAPWVLGFAHDALSTLLHVVGGAVITLLSGIDLLISREDPPWRFGPAAGRHADLCAAADTAADDCPAPVRWSHGAITGHRVRHVLRSKGGRLARAGDQPWKTHSQSRSSTEARRTSVCGARRTTKLNWDSGFSTNGSRNAILSSQKLKNAMPGRSWA
jgi:SPW repeat-containing protein